MMPVMAGSIVALRPHALDIEVWAPALESAGALLEAADCVVAVE
jgi:glutaminase